MGKYRDKYRNISKPPSNTESSPSVSSQSEIKPPVPTPPIVEGAASRHFGGIDAQSKFLICIGIFVAVVFLYTMTIQTSVGYIGMPASAKITGIIDGYTFKAYLYETKQDVTIKLLKLYGENNSMNNTAKEYAVSNLDGQSVYLMPDSRVGWFDNSGNLMVYVYMANGSDEYGSKLLLQGMAMADISGNYSLKTAYDCVQNR